MFEEKAESNFTYVGDSLLSLPPPYPDLPYTVKKKRYVDTLKIDIVLVV